MLSLAVTILAAVSLLQPSFANPIAERADAPVVAQTTCNGKKYTYKELAGYGFLPSDSRDKTGDTIGGIGSSIALDLSSWKKINGSHGKGDTYEGILYALPDRGWNTVGTQNTQSRIQKLAIVLNLMDEATVGNPSAPNFHIKYLDTILLSGPDGTLCTGLDADATGHLSFPGFPDLPVATYSGDGFGGPGKGGKRIAVDAEGLVLASDGSFWVSDEYGPYVYHFDKKGKMVAAIRPPDAFIPFRNGTESFSADSPPLYDLTLTITPSDPVSGRQNNQGFEGLTASPDGRSLYVLIQSALEQEGGTKKSHRRNARLLQYDVSKHSNAKYVAEYVVQLPVFGDNQVAAQSEIHYVSPTQFLILARDSGAGHGQSDSESVYRHADVFDISKATNVKSTTHDAVGGAIASTKGELNADIVPATYCSWLDYNVNAQLNRFGVHNGGAQDAGLLNEKWESLALAPISKDDKKRKTDDWDEYFLISFSDNDFITQNGFINFGKDPYKDASGFNLDNQALVFRVKLPKGSKLA
ncbi:uncharacterized protein BDZ99DRAFT_426605 [Mytilinidion resinicola]|uniref:Phytase-like domain-containing protein n=1 Tax=Mytilinidion resinicola TaxID=574789 RepID=A0A6A6Y5J2_9PEZI|nr:uncharacterized protein BDZ99DRAFT_426605 [Mytilinidion resinicola]KAF2803793.1 hypothetical protein BDZ99DRAFT_426605 [Mytilinidion resinicola]